MDAFWSGIASSTRVRGGEGAAGDGRRPASAPLDAQSEPDSSDSDEDGFDPDFAASTGVRRYLEACQREGVVPVQQLVATLDQESVFLAHRGIGPRGGRPLFECLLQNRHITALDISDNALGGRTGSGTCIASLCEALRASKQLASLDLGHNRLGAKGCEAVAAAVAGAVSLTDLSIRGNAVGDRGAQALVQAIRPPAKLESLDLSDNGLGDAAAPALADLLLATTPLRMLDVSWNALGPGGAVVVAEALQTSSLSRFSLAWNGIGDRGAVALGQALSVNASLEFLDASSNRVGTSGAVAIAESLGSNTSLRSLQLNGNPLGEEGALALVEAIGRTTSVRDLGLKDSLTVTLTSKRHCKASKSGTGIFDPLNPTGSYGLDLAAPPDREVLERLLEADRMDEASGIDNFRNVVYEGRAVGFPDGEDIQDWPIPERGVLAFDYVSGKKLPGGAHPIREEALTSFLRSFSSPALSEPTKLTMLRTAATTHYYRAAQARRIISHLSFPRRADAAVMLFRRIVDLGRFVDEVYRPLTTVEKRALRERLGEALAPLLPPEEEQAELLASEAAEVAACDEAPKRRAEPPCAVEAPSTLEEARQEHADPHPSGTDAADEEHADVGQGAAESPKTEEEPPPAAPASRAAETPEMPSGDGEQEEADLTSPEALEGGEVGAAIAPAAGPAGAASSMPSRQGDDEQTRLSDDDEVEDISPPQPLLGHTAAVPRPSSTSSKGVGPFSERDG